MGTRRILGVIPARLGSERLPRKPLHPLAGRPLIEWVWRRVATFSVLDAAVVATDSEEVADACRAMGAEVVLTSPDHRSGTERVAEVAAMPRYHGVDVVVNVQGDEPFVTEAEVSTAANLVGAWDVGTVATPLGTEEAWRDPAVVKVVVGEGGGALYFSRAAVPYVRGRAPTEAELSGPAFLRHIGIYAYGPEALVRWVSLRSSRLEELERLEQLRALEAGLRIGVGVVKGVETGGIDTPADAVRAERRLAELAEHSPSAT